MSVLSPNIKAQLKDIYFFRITVYFKTVTTLIDHDYIGHINIKSENELHDFLHELAVQLSKQYEKAFLSSEYIFRPLREDTEEQLKYYDEAINRISHRYDFFEDVLLPYQETKHKKLIRNVFEGKIWGYVDPRGLDCEVWEIKLTS